MKRKRALSATQEDYVEAIHQLILEKDNARVTDIAARLSVHKSTVTQALRSLCERGLVNYEPYSEISLTVRGREQAVAVSRRHRALRSFLVDVLAVESEIAEESACRMEHALPDIVVERLVAFQQFLHDRRRDDTGGRESFADLFAERTAPDGATIRK